MRFSTLYLLFIALQGLWLHNIYCKLINEQERSALQQIGFNSQFSANSRLLNKFLDLTTEVEFTNTPGTALENRLISTKHSGKISFKNNATNVEKFNLNFTFDCSWKLKTIIIQGAGNLNDELVELYTRYCPESFNITQHQFLIQKIEQKLSEHGFFMPQINESLELNFASKLVTVKVDLKLPKPCLIEHINLEICGPVSTKIETLKPKIIKLCKMICSGKRYDLQLLDMCKTKVQDFLSFNDINDLFIDTKFNQGLKSLIISLRSKVGQLSMINAAKKFLGNNSYHLEQSTLEEIIKRDCLEQGFCQSIMNINNNHTYSFTTAEPMIISEVKIIQLDGESRGDVKIACPKLDGQIFNKIEVGKVADSIKQEYLRAGFWNCSIEPRLRFLPDRQVSVGFEIFKGKKHVVDQYQVTELLKPEYKRVQHLIKSIVKFKQGLPANPYQIDKYKEQIEAFLKEEGFFKPTVTIEVETYPQDEAEAVDIFYEIKPGEKARFGAVVLDNKTKVPTKKIRNKLRFAPGDEWNLNKLKTSLKKIEAMNLFKDVRFSSMQQPFNTSDLTIPVRLTVTQDRPREFKASAGASVFGMGLKRELDDVGFSFHFGCQYIVKNPFMLADRIQAGFNVTRSKQTAELTYNCLEPFEIPCDSQLKGFIGRSGLKDSFALNQQPNDFVSRAGIVWGLRSESEILGSVQLCTGLEAICPPSMNRKDPENWTGYFIVGPNYSLDRVSSNWSNRFGNSVAFSSQLVLPIRKPGGFLRICLKDAIFIPLGRSACLAFELGLEHNQAFGRSLYPDTQTFARQELIKRNSVFFPTLTDRYDLPEAEQLVWEVLEQGPVKIFSLMSELRLRLIGQLAAVAFEGVRFLGNVGVVHATGFGLRYMTPFGMICIDLTAKWRDSNSIRDTCSWRVSLGQAF
jgi:hypothetical protein